MTIFGKDSPELTTYKRTHKEMLELQELDRLVRKYPGQALDTLFGIRGKGQEWVMDEAREVNINPVDFPPDPRTIHHTQGIPSPEWTGKFDREAYLKEKAKGGFGANLA